jgi:hypothetical protein
MLNRGQLCDHGRQRDDLPPLRAAQFHERLEHRPPVCRCFIDQRQQVPPAFSLGVLPVRVEEHSRHPWEPIDEHRGSSPPNRRRNCGAPAGQIGLSRTTRVAGAVVSRPPRTAVLSASIAELQKQAASNWWLLPGE